MSEFDISDEPDKGEDDGNTVDDVIVEDDFTSAYVLSGRARVTGGHTR